MDSDSVTDNINICPKFKAFWSKELQNQWYGWIDGANGKSCGVKLSVDDDDCYMTRGGYVASVFGLSEPTQVVLDYHVIENRFKMTIIKDENFVSVSGDDLFEKQISESDNDSTNSSFVESVGYPSDLSDSSNTVMREFVNDRLYGWKLTVSKSYADKRKLQVLHFPPPTAKYVLRGQYHVFIETLHNLNGVKCKISKAKRKNKINERYLTDGWYDWVRANNLREGDELRFQFDHPPDVLQVEIIRRKNLHKCR
ncbi:unnamed protein product [Trifolium pratense]|uniref:Uncharacterized protein n=1 Tax=Trifolium pratense TaxID=57577 RepID=A0ACB0K437_TRIPR|nr:unnamed protein product [Trifolium pratense]